MLENLYFVSSNRMREHEKILKCNYFGNYKKKDLFFEL